MYVHLIEVYSNWICL